MQEFRGVTFKNCGSNYDTDVQGSVILRKELGVNPEKYTFYVGLMVVNIIGWRLIASAILIRRSGI